MRMFRLLAVLGGALLIGPGLAPLPASAAPAGPASAGPASAGPAPAAPSPGPERYWIVGEPKAGQREYLYEIAMRTLGDGNRHQEILDLNRDRPQPDGGTLTDELTPLRPGWVLRLPPDATGPGVRTGALPVTGRGRPDASAGGGSVLTVVLSVTGVTAVVVARGLLRRARRATPVAVPAPAAPETPPAGPVRLTTNLEPLTAEREHHLDVRLLGADRGSGATPYAWVEGDDPPPEARLPVVLGRREGRGLLLDLAAVPDVLTITGRMALARPQAADLAEQVSRAGAAVVVVGGVLGGDAPAGATAAPDFAAAVAAADRISGAVVVVSGGLRGADLAAARALAARTHHRAVPVLIGEVIRARWSVTVNRVRSATTA
jgi:hypothetical protein